MNSLEQSNLDPCGEGDDISVDDEEGPSSGPPPSSVPTPSGVKTACQVCNECSPSMRPGSLACEACKKFFMRNYDVTKKFNCDNGGKCLQTGSSVNRRSCQACRMERCIALGLSEKVRPPKPAIDLRFVPCAVCGASSTGYHFGILSCEGCKGFFRRTVKYDLAKNFTCDSGGKCVIDPLRQKCKKCRFERCLSAGMSPTGSHIGRHTNAQRAETKREIERLQNEQKLLKAPIMVRQLKRGAAVAALMSPNTSGQVSLLSDSPLSKLEITSPANAVDPESVSPAVKRRSRSRHSSGGSNLPTPKCSESTPPGQSDALTTGSSSRTPHDFEMSKNSVMSTASPSSQFPVDEATFAAAQSLMSFFGGSVSSVTSPAPPSVPMSIENSPFQPPIPENASQPSLSNFNGISNFIARMNAAQSMTLPSPPAPSSVSTCSTFDITNNASTLSPVMFSSDYKMLGEPSEDNSRSAILRRIRMPVARSNFIWLYNSGADWMNIANLLSTPPPPPPALAPTQPMPVRQIGDPFSLHTFIRLLESDHLLPEPPLAIFPRSEWLIAQVTNAVRNLSHIKNLRIYFDPGWTADEVWRQSMVCFEHHTRYTLSFVRSLPGYAALSAPDRTTLFTAAAFPLVVAQLSLDYDMQEREENYLSMDPIGVELSMLNFQPLRQLRRHIIDAGISIKSSKLNVVEFGLIAALIFFNSEIPNLIEASKVRQIEEEFRQAVSIFVRRSYGNDLPAATSSSISPMSEADQRLQLVASHVRYLSSLHHSHLSVMSDFGRLFPQLVNMNPLHLEMYNNDPLVAQPPPPQHQRRTPPISNN